MTSPAVLGVDWASIDGNGTPDLPLARANGLRFAYIRACEGSYADPEFRTNWALLLANGIKRGAYLFLRYSGGGTPEQQVDEILSQLGAPPKPTDLPCAIDLESQTSRAAAGFTAAEALDWFRRARARYKLKTGFEAATYTSYVFWVDPAGIANLPAPELADTLLWVKYWPYKEHTIAHIDPVVIGALPTPPCPPPFGDSWMAEQYAGDAIKWPGFVSTVDCNRFNQVMIGSRGGLVAWVQRRVKVTADGVFGPVTAAAVRAFQTQHGLVADLDRRSQHVVLFGASTVGRQRVLFDPKCIAPRCTDDAVGGPFCPTHAAAPAVKRGGWISAIKRRRETVQIDASNIVQRLWVGSKPKPEADLPKVDVHVLCARVVQPEMANFHGRVINCPMQDGFLTEAELRLALHTSASVSSALAGKQRVLVTCAMGLNRSALVAGLALGRFTRLSAEQIIALIKKRRAGSLYNQHFQALLQRFIGAGRQR